MKVTVNACRKKRVKVDVNAVTSRRDIVRLPVRIQDAIEEADETENMTAVKPAARPDDSELSAIFDSAVFERAEARARESGEELPEIFVKPVKLINELADSKPELDDLPPYFNPRSMTEEEELREYSEPVLLVDGQEEPYGEKEGSEADGAADEARTAENEAMAEQQDQEKKKALETLENYTTEELLEIIDRQQRERKIRDAERAEKLQQREREMAKRAEEEREAARNYIPTQDEVSREEDTLFMWWSELDSNDEGTANTGADEALTQLQITGDIPNGAADIAAQAGSEQTERILSDDPYAEQSESKIIEDHSIGTGSGQLSEETDDFDGEYAVYSEQEDSGVFDFDAPDEFSENNDNTSVNVRYFDRDGEGERVEVERSAAVGQEVVIIDNESGKMKRICGIIKRGAAANPDEAEQGVTDENGAGKPAE